MGKYPHLAPSFVNHGPFPFVICLGAFLIMGLVLGWVGHSWGQLCCGLL